MIMGVVYLFAALAFGAVYLIFRNAMPDGAGGVVSEFLGVLQPVFSSVALKDVLTGGFVKAITTALAESFGLKLNIPAGTLIAALAAALVLILFSVKIAGFLCRRMIRKKMQKEDTRRGIIAILIRFLISTAFTAILIICLYYWFFSAIFMLVFYMVLKAVENIVEVKVIYFRDRKLKELLTFKHILLSLAAAGIFLFITAAVVIGLWALFNFWIGLLIGAPLAVYFFEIVKFTTVEYFENSKKPKTEEKI
jgi:hypothetical protein